jgi:alkyldihydroxyacetonephosphate synthase
MLQARLPLSMVRLSTATETETTLAMAGHELLLGGLSAYLRLRGVGEGKCMMVFGATGHNSIVDLGRREALRIARAHDGVYGTQTFGKAWHKNRFTSPYLRNTLWDAGYGIDTLETATDWTSVADLIPAVERAIREAMPDGERVHVFTHMSHLYPYGTSVYVQYVFRLAKTPEATLRRWSAMKRAASETIVDYGATISHQHGVGVDHKPYLAAEKGALGMETLRAAVETFDPDGLMNPGKLL